MVPYLHFLIVPISTLFLGAWLATQWQKTDAYYGLVQHFTAGVIFSAVTLELVPAMISSTQFFGTVIGFCIGVSLMLLLKAYADKLGIIIPTAVDLWIDGLLIAISFFVGFKGGVVLLVGLSFEALTLGMAMASIFKKRKLTCAMQLGTLTLFAMAILLGYISGDIINHVPTQDQIFPLILGFGVAALLYLVTEELLVEAHSVEDTPFITAMFFVGFLIPLVVAHI